MQEPDLVGKETSSVLKESFERNPSHLVPLRPTLLCVGRTGDVGRLHFGDRHRPDTKDQTLNVQVQKTGSNPTTSTTPTCLDDGGRGTEE